MKCLKNEQRHSDTIIAAALRGTKKQNTTIRAERSQKALKTIAEDFQNRHILDYLRGCSYNCSLSRIASVDPDSDVEEED